MFAAILVLALIGILTIIWLIVWWVLLSIARGRAIEELQIRLNMKLDRMDHFSRELENLRRDVGLIEDQQNAKTKPRKR